MKQASYDNTINGNASQGFNVSHLTQLCGALYVLENSVTC